MLCPPSTLFMLVEEEAHMENQPKQASWAEILRKEREQRAWTQEEVAEKLGIDARAPVE